jgi:putative two-component system response regulator
MRDRLQCFLQLGDAVIITDQAHQIMAVNDEYTRITGFKKEEIVGERASVLSSSITPKNTYDSMKMTLSTHTAWSGVFINRKKNKELWHCSITITPIDDEDEVYYVGVFRNLNVLSTGSYISESRKLKIQSEILRILAISCEIRDPAIEGHLIRVQQLTEKLALQLAGVNHEYLSEDYIHHLVNASILHDIGKSGIPEGILYKPGDLTYYERMIVETHPLIGVDILNKISHEWFDELLQQELDLARNIIEAHHEKWDGSGYPHKRSGNEIPFEAQIVSIVDVYDALISRRAYKEAWSHEKALAHIRSQRGISFSPAITDAFMTMKWD